MIRHNNLIKNFIKYYFLCKFYFKLQLVLIKIVNKIKNEKSISVFVNKNR